MITRFDAWYWLCDTLTVLGFIGWMGRSLSNSIVTCDFLHPTVSRRCYKNMTNLLSGDSSFSPNSLLGTTRIQSFPSTVHTFCWLTIEGIGYLVFQSFCNRSMPSICKLYIWATILLKSLSTGKYTVINLPATPTKNPADMWRENHRDKYQHRVKSAEVIASSLELVPVCLSLWYRTGVHAAVYLQYTTKVLAVSLFVCLFVCVTIPKYLRGWKFGVTQHGKGHAQSGVDRVLLRGARGHSPQAIYSSLQLEDQLLQ